MQIKYDLPPDVICASRENNTDNIMTFGSLAINL